MSQTELDTATEEGVASDEQISTLTSPESPRMRALAEIEARNKERLQEETGETFDNVDAQVAEQTAAPVEKDPEPTPAPAVAPVQKVKIDGMEQEVPIDELVRTYQKNRAADARLEEAARILRQAQQAQQKQPVALDAAQPAEAPEDLRKQAADTLAKLYDGDQDAAADALVQLLTKAKTGGDQPTHQPAPAIDTEALTEQVLERMAINTAFEKVKTDYPEIVSDPDLETLAAMKLDRRVAAGESRASAMLAVADELYKALGKTPAGRESKPAEPEKSTRQANKERLDKVPTASAAAINPQSPAEAMNPSALIAEMARNRLGQSLPR